MKKILFVLLIIPFVSIGQNAMTPVSSIKTGINFEHGQTWSEILAKAKEENKYIFVDCYATWCGPCKYMSRNVFTQKKVADYFNTNFINVEIQMDQTAKDSQEIKNWYADAATIAKIYGLGVYPTYLFFSPQGMAVHRITGVTEDGSEFISKAKNALDSSTQYYTLLNQWPYHKDDSAYLLHVLTTVLDVSDKDNMIKVGNAFMDCFTGPITYDKVMLVQRLVNSSESRGFKLFLDSASRINELMKKNGWAENKLSPIIFEERLSAFFSNGNARLEWNKISMSLRNDYPTIAQKLIENIEIKFRQQISFSIRTEISKENTILKEKDWMRIAKQLNSKFPDYDYNQILLQEKTDYYGDKKLWASCTNTAFQLIRQYGARIGDRDINNISWDYIFLHTSDPKILLEASKWMRNSIDKDSNRVTNMDTYANLLYKLGRHDEAILWENKAIEIAERNHTRTEDLTEFKGNLAKMEEGKQTWDSSNATGQN